jgi:hypothetical protein
MITWHVMAPKCGKLKKNTQQLDKLLCYCENKNMHVGGDQIFN